MSEPTIRMRFVTGPRTVANRLIVGEVKIAGGPSVPFQYWMARVNDRRVARRIARRTRLRFKRHDRTLVWTGVAR